ncbi:hypothetical protein HID58_016923 [Brassica napus]|uniref:Uncharacterized protein n=1 Tax=Brassica napus TaxID=3708 RepID=A0ABQ8D6P9_BRANA|nr:hypothetical protein HID58_016923 [Brassica napus]
MSERVNAWFPLDKSSVMNPLLATPGSDSSRPPPAPPDPPDPSHILPLSDFPPLSPQTTPRCSQSPMQISPIKGTAVKDCQPGCSSFTTDVDLTQKSQFPSGSDISSTVQNRSSKVEDSGSPKPMQEEKAQSHTPEEEAAKDPSPPIASPLPPSKTTLLDAALISVDPTPPTTTNQSVLFTASDEEADPTALSTAQLPSRRKKLFKHKTSLKRPHPTSYLAMLPDLNPFSILITSPHKALKITTEKDQNHPPITTETPSLPSSSSTLFFFTSGVPTDEIEQIKRETGLSHASLPIRYLGIPLVTKKLSVSNCEPLLLSVKAKLDSWSARTLSFAGRLLLINTRSSIFGCLHHEELPLSAFRAQVRTSSLSAGLAESLHDS